MERGCRHRWIIGVEADSPPGAEPARICGRCGERDTRTLRLVSGEGDWVWVCPCGGKSCRTKRRQYYRERFRPQPTPRSRQESRYEIGNKKPRQPEKGTKKHGFLPDTPPPDNEKPQTNPITATKSGFRQKRETKTAAAEEGFRQPETSQTKDSARQAQKNPS